MGKLTDKIRSAWQRLTYNRITLAAGGLFAGGGYSLYEATNEDGLLRIICGMGCAIGVGYGVALASLTSLGKDTVESYSLTLKHYAKTGEIESAFIVPKLEYYCNRQGVYLACKKTGQLDNFKNAMESKGMGSGLNF